MGNANLLEDNKRIVKRIHEKTLLHLILFGSLFCIFLHNHLLLLFLLVANIMQIKKMAVTDVAHNILKVTKDKFLTKL